MTYALLFFTVSNQLLQYHYIPFINLKEQTYKVKTLQIISQIFLYPLLALLETGIVIGDI